MSTNPPASVTTDGRTSMFEGGRVRLPLRQRVLDRLIEETGTKSRLNRLTVFSAPTGYSKTRTVAAWLGSPGSNEVASSSAEPVEWVQCASTAGDSLWAPLAQILSSHVSIEASALSMPDSQRTPDDVARLVELLAVPLTIVIDDYQHETSAENDLAIANLSSISQHLNLVIITRRSVLFDSTLVAARTRIRRFNATDLAFTTEEMHEFAESLGIPLTAKLQETFNQTGGWPLAIRAALNLGSDSFYLDLLNQESWHVSPEALNFNPRENLEAFALDYLKLLLPQARDVIIASSQLDAISLPHIQQLLRTDAESAQAIALELVELGLLIPSTAVQLIEFHCHTSVRQPLSDLSTRTVPFAQRAESYRTRAAEIQATAPLTAFKLLCAAAEYARAEELLACNFTTLTDEVTQLDYVLRSIPEEVFLKHPTLVAAQIFLKLPRSLVARASLEYLIELWMQGLQSQLPQGSATVPGPIHLPLLCQTMVAARLTGQLETSASLLQHLDARLIPNYLADEDPAQATQVPLAAVTRFAGSLPIYFREAAATALVVEDYDTARRNLIRLQRHSERKMSRPWRGFPRGSTRTVTDVESGNRWLLSALSELAFTEMLDGDMRAAAARLEEIDTHTALTGAKAPGISWAGAEIARAHLAYETNDKSRIERAADRLLPLRNRLESWQLFLIAEAAHIRLDEGPEAALTHLRATVAQALEDGAPQHKWSFFLTAFEAMLCTSTGDFAQAERLISSGPAGSVAFRIEQARLALFAGEHVEAVLLASSVADLGSTKRQRVDRDLIIAVASHALGNDEEAFAEFKKGSLALEQYNLSSRILVLPFAELHALAIAARGKGVHDLVPQLESVPEHARPRSYGRLTEMELRTLKAVAEHGSTSSVASVLFVTPGTVKKHLASVYRKLGVNGRNEAVLVAGRMGILNVDPSA